ncbi:TonB-dependent receptor [Acinetobacter sp. ANC 4558]|uniref:TonB-dependent receptor plug domain-containing protein n=1 Tax=Acinetobacter sp. ANC 4558 TaxID=1977876 RepID=UPI000A34353C|nr:TonB-dependent receptor [Acinetobacter sp. ANC 4558]OTG84147.1 TonB-dependent receptor [Acinetobacter sp. ANC 4558]
MKALPSSILKSSIFILSALAGSIALANESLTPKQSEEDVITLESVVVTGSRRAVKSPLDASAPVDIISEEQLKNTGTVDLSKALTILSPSFTFPLEPAGAFAAQIPAGASLRGLASDQVLVLINGKRRHTGAIFTRQNLANGRGAASVDLSLIPLNAVKRVEILRDGAAAQYGSDALAGVINIILKDDDDHGAVSYRFGEFSSGQGAQNKISAWKGFSLPNDGSLTFAIEYGNQDYANNTNPDNRRFYPLNYPNAEYLEANSPYRHWRFGSPKVKDQVNSVLNGELPLTDTIKLYGFATYGYKESVGQNFYQPPNTNTTLNQNPYYLARYPHGRITTSIYSLYDYAITTGVKNSDFLYGKVDFSVNYGRNKASQLYTNGINPSYGYDSPSDYKVGDNINEQTNVNLDYQKPINVAFFEEPITFATGLAYRREQYQQIAGDPIAYTRGPFYNPSPVIGVGVPEIYSGITDQDERKVSRDVFGGYFDVEAKILPKVVAGLAFRAEDYSDFGSTTNGKLSLKYDIDPRVSVRSTYSTGYRAPSITQLGFSAYSRQTVLQSNGVYQDVSQRTLLPGSEAALLLGGKDLEPEKSKNISLGFVFKPLKNLSATVDIYKIDIKNRILLSDNITGSIIKNAFAGTPYAEINNVAFFNNLLDTQTKGLEITTNYALDFEKYGQLKLNLGYSTNKNKITKTRDAVTIKGEVIPFESIAGRSTRGLIESASPKNKLTLGTDWTIDNWIITTHLRRYGEWSTIDNTRPAFDQTFSPQWIADLNIGYKPSMVKGLRIDVGAYNLFNSYPDRAINTSVGGVVKYSFNSPEGGNGTFIYSKLTYDF